MRVRISLSGPFSESKFLLSLPEGIQTISQLKKHLFTSLSSISSVVSSSREIKLEIEGFELLVGSGVDVLRDGDVVQISTRPDSSALRGPRASSKRRSVSLDTRETVKRTRRTSSAQMNGASRGNDLSTGKMKCREPSSSPSTSSASSSASSASSSSGSSSSSVDSSSSASLSTTSPPVRIPISKALDVHPRPPSTNPFPVLVNGIHDDQHVPPGKGKPETRNRNARRRRSRQYKRAEAASTTPVNGNSAAGALEDAQVKAIGGSSGLTNGDVMPVEGVSRLPNANRNKRKGFFKDMVNQRGVKTTFSDGREPHSTMAKGHIDAGPSTALVPLVPGSKRSSLTSRDDSKSRSGHSHLPSNVFVTSVDFGRPGPSSARSRRAVAEPEPYMEDDMDATEQPTKDSRNVNVDLLDGSVLPETKDLWDFQPEDVFGIAERIEKAFHEAAFAPVKDATVIEDLEGKYLVWTDVVLVGCSPQPGIILAKVLQVTPTPGGGSVTVRQVPIDRDGYEEDLGQPQEVELTKEELLVPAGDFKSDYRVIEDIHPYLTDPGSYMDL